MSHHQSGLIALSAFKCDLLDPGSLASHAVLFGSMSAEGVVGAFPPGVGFRARSPRTSRPTFTEEVGGAPANVEASRGLIAEAPALPGLAFAARAEGDLQTERQTLRDTLLLYTESGICTVLVNVNPMPRSDTQPFTSKLEVLQ